MQREIFRCFCFFLFCILCIKTSGQNKALDAIHARLKNKEDFKNQVIGAITRQSSGSKFIQLANDAAKTIDEVDIVVEGILASNELKPQALPPDNSPAPNSKLVPVWVQNFFDEVVNYVINEKNKETILPDPPPDASFDYCYPCDEERKAKYSKDTATYFQKFFGNHGNMISKGIQVIRYFQVRIDKKLPYDKEAAVRMTEKMNKDVDFLMNDMAQRVLTTWNLYKNNATQLSALNHLVLSLNRHHQLLGMAVPKDFPDLNAVGQQMYNIWTKYYDDAVDRRDYPVMLNINWYIGLLRQITLLYGELPVPERLNEFMEANRFEMIVDAEAELGKDGQTMMAKMKGSNFYRAVPDNDCKLRWYLYDPNGKMMQFNLENTEVNIGAPATYTGTKDWQTPPAEILLGFCDKPTRDTLIMQNFLPNGKESWVIQGQSTPGNFVQSIFTSCFMDEKRIRAEAVNLKAKEAQLKKELMAEYEKAVKGNEYLMAKDPKTMTKEEREKLQKLVVASQEIQNKLTSTAVAHNLIFNQGLQNNLKTVFDEEIDGRALFPRNTAIIRAIFKVKLVHVE